MTSKNSAQRAVSRATAYKKSRLSKARKIVAVLRAFVGDLEQSCVLDIGTAYGTIAAYVAHHVKTLVSVDLKDQRTQKSVQLILVGDERLPFRSGSFDIVITNHVIEHMRDQEEHLREIHRVLRDGGVCYLATPNRYGLLEPHYQLPLLFWFPRRLSDLYLRLARGVTSHDVRPLSAASLNKLATTAGFVVHDLTVDVIESPSKYALEPSFATSIASSLPRWLLRIAKALVPTFILLLSKRETLPPGKKDNHVLPNPRDRAP